MRFSRQVYWSGLPYPPPGDLPDPGIEPVSLHALTGRFFTTMAIWEALGYLTHRHFIYDPLSILPMHLQGKYYYFNFTDKE